MKTQTQRDSQSRFIRLQSQCFFCPTMLPSRTVLNPLHISGDSCSSLVVFSRLMYPPVFSLFYGPRRPSYGVLLKLFQTSPPCGCPGLPGAVGLLLCAQPPRACRACGFASPVVTTRPRGQIWDLSGRHVIRDRPGSKTISQ